jgi:predicted lipid-binding transport protein (Tim44 family)
MAFDANKYDAAAPATGGSMIGSALLGSQSWGVPAGFDAEGFLKASKANFVTLQDAWDRSDIQSLRAMMTDDMLEQIKTQLADRESHTGGVNNKTEVVMLNAQLLGIEELSDVYMASVEFSGMIREDASAGASPFREVWNMTKPRSGGGWLVAGVQALQ